MTTKIDLNADLGEGYGPWSKGDDSAMLEVVSSANIACGFHAGDPDIMAKTVRLALQYGVAIGAHPGFADLHGFGRRRMSLSKETLRNLVRYQIGALDAITRAEGGRIAHLKLHGALANMASEDEELALACYQAALDVAPDLGIFVIAATAQERAARRLDVPVACEIFADRAYNRDATLVDRSQDGAVITDPDLAANRCAEMVSCGGIKAQDGAWVDTAIDTICVHGDSESAVAIARAVKKRLESEQIRLNSPFEA